MDAVFSKEYLDQAASKRSKYQRQFISAGTSQKDAANMAAAMVANEDKVELAALKTALAHRALEAKKAKHNGNGKHAEPAATQLPLAQAPTTEELLSQINQNLKRIADGLWTLANRKAG